MCPASRQFTEAEYEFIRANYHSMPHGDIARHLGRSVSGVRKAAGKLGIRKSLKRWGSEEDKVIQAAWGRRPLADVAEQLGRSISEVSSRSKKLGRERWRKGKGTHSGRPIDGFKDGSPVFTHRRIAEQIIGRRLRSNEIVHHIDFDKHNNDPSNLVIQSRSEHRKSHSSFERLVPELVRLGIIKFDRDTGIYELCETSK